MSDLLPVQRDLARLLFSLPEAAGYALAGGAALVVQQIVDRDTRDLDAFIAATPGPSPGTVEIDLAVDSPLLEPPTAIDGIPVLAPLDLAARKVLTIVDRLEARDYTDLHALAHLVGQQTCIDSALTMDAGLSVSAIAEAFKRIDRIAEDRYPERATDAATTRRYFTTWAHELLDDH